MDWSWSSSSSTLATWCKGPTHRKRLWCWEQLKAGGEGDNRGRDDWMTSPTQWTRVWASYRCLWRIGKSGMHFMGSQSWTWLSNWTTKTLWKEGRNQTISVCDSLSKCGSWTQQHQHVPRNSLKCKSSGPPQTYWIWNFESGASNLCSSKPSGWLQCMLGGCLTNTISYGVVFR